MRLQADTTLLVTGGCGFIGTNLIRYILSSRPRCRVINLDCLSYAGNLNNLTDLEGSKNYVFVKCDISKFSEVASVFQRYSPAAVINCAAESHVDRSLNDSKSFVTSNVLGTQVLLELARDQGCRLVQISTDEVYGSLGPAGKFSEDSPLSPNSPYAATKAAADLMALAAFNSFGQDVVITRSSNNYGPYQYPEKLIPLMITNAIDSCRMPIYGQGSNIRDWIHVSDHCKGILAVLENGSAGSIYNLGGGREETNLDVVRMILSLLNKPESLIEFVTDRPGHDLRYAMDFKRAQNDLRWSPKIDFEPGLSDTVKWYQENAEWWRPIKNGTYRDYYAEQYATRLKDQK